MYIKISPQQDISIVNIIVHMTNISHGENEITVPGIFIEEEEAFAIDASVHKPYHCASDFEQSRAIKS